MTLEEHIKLRTELGRELLNSEVDKNFQYVANPWKPNRVYTLGEIIYHTLDDVTLAWFKAKQTTTLGVFNEMEWIEIGSSGAIDSLYIRPDPIYNTVGGAISGVYTPNGTIQDTLDAILYPYLSPAFLSFSISGQSTSIEVGTEIVGLKNFIWTTSNPTNINTNSIYIKDLFTNTFIISGTNDDGSESISIGPIYKSVPGNYQWRISATNTNSIDFLSTYTVNWKWRIYAGNSSNTTLSESEIEALSYSSLATGFARTYNFTSGNYKYICYPDEFGSPAPFIGFKDSSTNLNVAMATVSDNGFYSNVENGWYYGIVSVTNDTDNPQVTDYRVYRTQYTIGADIDIIVV